MDSNKNQKKIIIFIALSLLLHTLIFMSKWSIFRAKPAPKIMTVERVDLDKNQKQIIDFSPSLDKTPPKESKYLSKQDQSAPEETKAPVIGKTQNSTPSVEVLPSPKLSTPTKKTLSMADLGLQRNLSPSKAASRKPSMAKPPSATDDYLPDVKAGAQTTLNTREFKFYSYFERIKERLRMYWEPELQERIQKLYAQGETFSDSDLITKLYISLTPKGELSKIVILKNSGFEDIDQAALKAFEKAAPFPNPPSGMVEKGKVELTWSFVVQTKGLSDIFVFLTRR